MNKIIYATDLHGNEEVYNKLFSLANNKNITNIVIGGDICPNSRISLNEDIKLERNFIENFLLNLIKKNKKITTFIQMGNDDFKVNMDLLEKADKEGILRLTHHRLNKLGKYCLIGYSFVNELPFRLKDWEKMDNKHSNPLTNPDHAIRTVKQEKGTIKEDLEKLKKLSNPKNTVYIFHVPPFNTNLDLSYKGHVGSKSIKEFINKEKPLLTLHGHIHESPQLSNAWKENINKTLSINPGSNHINNKLNCVIINLDKLEEVELIQC